MRRGSACRVRGEAFRHKTEIHEHRAGELDGGWVLLGLPESNADTPFGTIKAYCARHGGDLSEAETRELIMTLLTAREQGGHHGI